MAMGFLLYLAVSANLLCLGYCGKVSTSAALNPSQHGVKLEVVTASSDYVLQEAEDSTKIQLRASFSAEERARGVSLYDCKAVSEDGETELLLTDSEGCPTEASPMGCMVEGKNDTVVSPVFQLSSLADAGHVKITCCLEMCMAPHDPKCMDRCDYFTKQHSLGQHTMTHKYRRPRRDGDGDVKTPRRYVSTSIRVLPSHVRRAPFHHHHHGHHTNGHHTDGHMGSAMHLGPGPDEVPYQEERPVVMRESSPLLYLNPITCSIFLLVLVVFLGLYVSFVRSLRHSVDDIKREIEVQRSRDKFLVR